MNEPEDDLDRAFRAKFSLIAPILEKHFPGYPTKKIANMTHRFIYVHRAALFEAYDYDFQMRHLAHCRHHIREAALHLSKIDRSVEEEIRVNITLPFIVLNGQEDRKTCAEEIFDQAPSAKQIDMSQDLFRALREMSDHIDKAILYTMGYLPKGIPARNRNIEAWRIVESIVEVIRICRCEMHIPERMGRSGPLWRLIDDLLKAHELTGTADAAFNGWLRHIDRKRESLELLPID